MSQPTINSSSIHHDVPHFAIFHSRNSTGICPVCLLSESKSWSEMLMRCEQALEIARSQVQREREERTGSAARRALQQAARKTVEEAVTE